MGLAIISAIPNLMALWTAPRHIKMGTFLFGVSAVLLLASVVTTVAAYGFMYPKDTVATDGFEDQGSIAVPAAPASKPMLHYSTGDRDRISDALAEISEIMNQEIIPLQEKGDAIMRAYAHSKEVDPALEGIGEYQKMLHAINNKLDPLLNKKYVIYKDLLNEVLKLNPEPQLSKTLTRSLDLQGKLRHMHDMVVKAPVIKHQVEYLLPPTDSLFAGANNELKPWVQGVNERIDATRVAISRAEKR